MAFVPRTKRLDRLIDPIFTDPQEEYWNMLLTTIDIVYARIGITTKLATPGNRSVVMNIIAISATIREDIMVKATFEAVSAILNENSF
jgi:hypothetical protein